MSLEKAKEHLKKWGLDGRIQEFSQSSATVELAARALGCEPQRIAKTLSFLLDGRCILIVTAGDSKVDNRKYKEEFGAKAKMIPAAQVEERTGHAVGGVCPFGAKEDAQVYLDVSLKRFETVFPACGSANSALELSTDELEECSGCRKWVDVCTQRS